MAMRTVHCTEAVAWLSAHEPAPDAAFVTSLPDVSETALSLDAWHDWFVSTARLILGRCPPDGAAIFYQTDIKAEGRWIDKGYLCQRAAECAGVRLLWHKIVCRKPPDTPSFGRPAYSHLLCFAPRLVPAPSPASPDVLSSTGKMLWSRAMGLAAAVLACRWLRQHTSCRVVVDPFCGIGTALAVANAMGLDAIGVDRSPKRCRRARTLVLGTQFMEAGGCRE